jgi:hypothetical protein
LRRKTRPRVQAYADDGCRGKQTQDAASAAMLQAAGMQALRQLLET